MIPMRPFSPIIANVQYVFVDARTPQQSRKKFSGEEFRYLKQMIQGELWCLQHRPFSVLICHRKKQY